MAAFSTFHRLYIVFSEIDDDESIFGFVKQQRLAAVAAASMPRDYMPKITNYMSAVFQDFRIPEHIDDFRTHFRISTSLFEVMLQEIYISLNLKGSGPYAPISPEKQLLVFLWYVANKTSMREVAHLFGLSKSTVHTAIFRVMDSIQELGPRVGDKMALCRKTEISHEVEQICRLPGVIGFLDGSHIRLSSAINGDRDFFNRKGFPSMQLQAVVDHEMRFTNIYTGWAGCVHDVRVLRSSGLYTGAEAGDLVLQDHHILADNAYPLRNWLIVPFKNFGNLTPQQVRFNKRLSSVRQTVERAFAHLKGRFRKIQEVPFHIPEEVCSLIHTVCILHNFCIDNADHVEDYFQEQEDDPNQNQNIYENGHNGIVRRLRLVNIN